MAGLILLKDETLLKEIKPHYLAFWDMYLVWVWVIILSLVFISYGQEISQAVGSPVMSMTDKLPSVIPTSNSAILKKVPAVSQGLGQIQSEAGQVSGFFRSYSTSGLWIVALVLSAVFVSVFRIEWKWILLMLGVGVASVMLTLRLELPADAAYYFGMLFSVVGIACVEVYRRAHTFFITDRRIVTEVIFTSHKRNELSYDKINNLILDQSFLGRIFDFGTIIPVTASGLGMGSDFSAVSVGSQGSVGGLPLSAQVTGGRSVQTPRVRSMYGVWGIPEPEKVQHMISEHLHEYVEAPYLKRMTDQLEDIKKGMGNSKGGD